MGKKRRFFKRNTLVYLVIFTICGNFLVQAEQDWRTRNSHHFIVYYKNSSHRFLDRLINKAEDSYRTITQDLGFSRDEPWVWKKRALIYVYDTKDEYLENSDRPEWSVGFARPCEKTVYTYSDSYDFLKDVLVHELTHLILREFIGSAKVPLWFEEGVATYMERKKDASTHVSKMRTLVKEARFIGFDDFLRLKMEDMGGERNLHDALQGQNLVERFYLQSFSVIYFLFEEYKKYKFLDLLRKIKKEGSFDGAFFKVYRVFRDEKDLERQWVEFYR